MDWRVQEILPASKARDPNRRHLGLLSHQSATSTRVVVKNQEIYTFQFDPK